MQLKLQTHITQQRTKPNNLIRENIKMKWKQQIKDT